MTATCFLRPRREDLCFGDVSAVLATLGTLVCACWMCARLLDSARSRSRKSTTVSVAQRQISPPTDARTSVSHCEVLGFSLLLVVILVSVKLDSDVYVYDDECGDDIGLGGAVEGEGAAESTVGDNGGADGDRGGAEDAVAGTDGKIGSIEVEGCVAIAGKLTMASTVTLMVVRAI